MSILFMRERKCRLDANRSHWISFGNMEFENRGSEALALEFFYSKISNIMERGSA